MRVFIAEDQFLLRRGLEELLTAGASNTRIAEQLVVTEKAVAKHINSIFAKLDLSDDGSNARRVQAVTTFLRH